MKIHSCPLCVQREEFLPERCPFYQPDEEDDTEESVDHLAITQNNPVPQLLGYIDQAWVRKESA